MVIPVYIINLKKRTDRKLHVLDQFSGRSEFECKLIEAQECENGVAGLWHTIVDVIRNHVSNDQELIVLCEDDHTFTPDYDQTVFKKAISYAKDAEADILLGGVSWFDTVVQISSSLFWIDKFSGLQFTVIYRRFFKTILETENSSLEPADYKIAGLSSNKLLLYPFISTQKEFGYSDVTFKNNKEGYITQIFKQSSEKLGQLKEVAVFYKLEVAK